MSYAARKKNTIRIFLLVLGQLDPDRERLGAPLKPADGSPDNSSDVEEEIADEAATSPRKSEDGSRLHADRGAVRAYLDGIYPRSCSKSEIAERLEIDLERVARALESLAKEKIVMHIDPDQWRLTGQQKES